MQKQIHVNSYVKRDGTQVREHFRTIDTDNYGTPPFVPDYPDGPILDEQNHGSIEDLLPDIFKPVLNMDSAPVLTGGVSHTDWGDVWGNLGGTLGTIVTVGLELAPIALRIYQGMQNGNSQALGYLKPQFDNGIKQLDTHVAQMKKNINNSVSKLLDSKDKTEYSKIYEPLAKDWQKYQHAQNLVNRIKAHASNNNYSAVANELNNFTSNNQRQIISDMLQPNVKLQNNSVNARNLINKYNLDDKFKYALKNNVSGVNHSADFSRLAENNYLMSKNIEYNSNRQNAKEMANIFLAKPSMIPLSKEYSYIPRGNGNIINLKYNLTSNKVIPQDWEGIVFNQYSSLSKHVSNSIEMQNEIKRQFNIMKTDTMNEKLEVDFSKDSNLHLSIGHATILEPYIDTEGYFHGILFDKYDFDKIYSKYLFDFKTTTANNLFYFIQLSNGHNYYILVPIIFKW